MKVTDQKALDRIKKVNVAVLGEAILDVFIEGVSQRLSREAPVPIVEVESKKAVAGGAANTAVNTTTLSAHTYFLSVVGKDKEGESIKTILSKYGVETRYVVEDTSRKTLSKQRVVANSQELVRYDQGTTSPISTEAELALIQNLKKILSLIDVLIVSDYGYGVITSQVLKTLSEIRNQKEIIIAVDSKNLRNYKEVKPTLIKPNYIEVVENLGLTPVSDSLERFKQVRARKKNLFECCDPSIIAVTLDKDGALLFKDRRYVYRTYARPVKQSNSIGAGDTFISAFTLGLAAGMSLSASAELAAAASQVVVDKTGTAPCYLNDLEIHSEHNKKIVSNINELLLILDKTRKEGKQIVFTNGCFDIIHSGHVTYLSRARELGDVLVVGVNSDKSVRHLKGWERPVNPLPDRLKVLTGLSSIDYVIPFEEYTPIKLIKTIKPHIFVKGGDYTLKTLPEAPFVKKYGGKVKILPYIEGKSTTGIIEKIQRVFLDRFFFTHNIRPR
ncbi:MAG: D-glycero-beta-D-manno-heptose 1-phosphate adenylyltransferase [Patescibacteria group bacterium]|jgi:D-beta-D-heptose 7-phosphate kinase/D-beta-D-heptose 1-phosphate adenosyltransferase